MWRFSLLILFASSAAAKDLPEMPDYFAEALVSISAAQAIAQACPSITVNPVNAVKSSEDLITRLADDGFDSNDPASGMQPGDAKIAELQTVFLEKHGLSEGAAADAACAAGKSEIAQNSAIGRLLLEAAQ